jgi:hypothetical protein
MKCTLTVMALFVCGLTYAQDTSTEQAEQNIEYEKLKVLEPLVGTFLMEGTNEQEGTKWEWVHSTDWSGPEKKMLITETKFRSAGAEADLEKQEWAVGKGGFYYVWNNAAKRIEYIAVMARRGSVTVSEVKCNGDGLYSLKRLSTTVSPAGSEETTVTVDDQTLLWKITNRKSADGQPEEDMVFDWKRVK